MPSDIYVHFNHNIIEHTHAKILGSALQRQVSWGDTNDEVCWSPMTKVQNSKTHTE